MHKIYRYITFFSKHLIYLIVKIFINLFRFIKLKDRVIFGLRDIKNQDLFLHNSKYLFLYLSQNNIDCIWLTSNKHLIEVLNKYGYKVYERYSIKGIYYALTSKYWITDFSHITHCISIFLPPNAIRINLWHGIPLKKIQNDTPESLYYKQTFVEHCIKNFLDPNFNYYISAGMYDSKCFKTAFDVKEEQIIQLGNPRLDTLFTDVQDASLFMNDDFNIIKNLKQKGKKLLLYVPTFRKDGKNISNWLLSEELKILLKNNNAVLICKLHYLDKNSLTIKNNETLYKLDGSSDIYPILKYFDILITDYSSIYFDYLLLDKPIIYNPVDINEYKEKYDFYSDYEELTAGVKAYNESELLEKISETINGVDNYKEQRKVLRDRMFRYQDGKNCERVVEWIKSLGK